MRTLVLGLGNPILTDDGVGIHVANAVKSMLPDSSPVDVSEVSVGGLALMEAMIGYDRVILIDALTNPSNDSDVIVKMNLEDLQKISAIQHSASPHDTSLITAIEAGKKLGYQLPEDITIYAIRVENILDFSDQPTPRVAKAIPQVTAAILADLSGSTN